MACTPSDDSDQTGRMPRLIWVIAGCTWASAHSDQSLLSAWRTLGSATHWADKEDWSDWADAQTDLSLHFIDFLMRRLINEPHHNTSFQTYATRLYSRLTCWGTKASKGLGIMDIATIGIILWRQQIIKPLIRLLMRRLFCAFVILIWLQQVFSWHDKNNTEL